MYTLSLDAPFDDAPSVFPSALRRALTPARTGALVALALAFGAAQIVPWHQDQAASQGLAQLLATAPASALKAATVAAAVPPAPVAAMAVPEAVPAPAAPAAAAATPVVESRTIALTAGQTLATALQTQLGAVTEEAKAAMEAVRHVMDLRRLKAGTQLRVTMKQDGETRNLVGLSFLAEPTKQITLGRDAAGAFDADAVKVPTTYTRFAAGGVIKGSLYDAAGDAGVPREIVRELMKAFSYTVDFQRDLQPGDRFQVYYGQDATKNGDRVGGADIIYATLQIGGKLKQLYRYEYDRGQFDYFDESGKSVRRGLLRTPVDNPHITSGFGVRMHPILGFTKMHTGVDFGSPQGAPIYAAGDGVVEQAGWFSDYGRYVKIRHNGRLETAYGHMSAISVQPGQRIRQGDKLGAVGATGRATGPHLHYEVIVNNQKVNPVGVNVDAGRQLGGRQLTAFKAWRQQMQQQYASGTDLKAKPVQVALATAPGKAKN